MTDLRQVVARIAYSRMPLHESFTGAPIPWEKLTEFRQTEMLWVADAVLAAVSASIGEDVVEAAVAAVLASGRIVAADSVPEQVASRTARLAATRFITTVTPLIALAARDATLEEAAKAIDDYVTDCLGDQEKGGAMGAAEVVRALKHGGHGRD